MVRRFIYVNTTIRFNMVLKTGPLWPVTIQNLIIFLAGLLSLSLAVIATICIEYYALFRIEKKYM